MLNIKALLFHNAGQGLLYIRIKLLKSMITKVQ